ncbi:MAG: DUF2273 domain-containing protein [bacterium]|nr:DUF2273 domain-containing protein [bacterium]
MDNSRGKFTEWLSAYPGMAIGAGAGLLAAVLLLTLGFVKTLILIGCIGGGILAGNMLMGK